MIGSFWNLCRACPSMPVDKLHSEYRSTYRWHEYTGPRQEVVRRAPQPSTSGPMAPGAGLASSRPKKSTEDAVNDGHDVSRFEPALPRRKKRPELAYRTHEFLAMSEVIGSDDSLDSTITFDRARSEERERGGVRVRPSRRSKSEGPRLECRLQYTKMASPPTSRRKRVLRSDSNPCEGDGDHYMFAWPRGRSGSSRGRPGAGIRTEEVRSAAPRKSLSMGAIRPVSGTAGPVAVHKKRITDYDRGVEGAPELEPLVGGETTTDGPSAAEPEELRGEEKIRDETIGKEEKPRRRKEFKTEYKKKFRPFSQYDYVEGKFQKKKELEDAPLSLLLTDGSQSDSWYREVLELRKKAGEYKHRGWGTELVPQHIAELYNKQMTLWEQVSRRSSLSALSLASTTPRSITKEEKEKENNKKSSPTKPLHRPATTRPSTAQDKTTELKKKFEEKDMKKDGPRSRKEYLIRHHLERTTGSVDGVLLPSPTREKLEPVIPRQKEEDLPKSPQKASPKSSPRSARSQSVGPGLNVERRSPKRQPRTPSAAPVSHKAVPPVQAERRPRPTCGTKLAQGEFWGPRVSVRSQPTPHSSSRTPSLSTTAPYRPKSSAGSFKAEDGKSHQVTKPKPMPAKPVVGVQGAKVREDRTKVADKQPSGGEETPTGDVGDAAPELDPTESDLTTLVKSPPEPTRVKSPEQILMRSPEPVNWTVPLDTGKTFTVTQNVRQALPNVKLYRGESINRPHSEVKAWTPPGLPPPAPQSAPPQLPQQPQEWKSADCEPPSDSLAEVNGIEDKFEGLQSITPPLTSSSPPASIQFEKSVEGTTLRCLEDPGPILDMSGGYQPPPSHGPYRVLEAPSPTTSPYDPSNAPSLISPSGTGRSVASDVLEKARTRFDKFWGTGKGKDDKEGKV